MSVLSLLAAPLLQVGRLIGGVIPPPSLTAPGAIPYDPFTAQSVSSADALALPAFGRALDLIGSTVAGLPISVFTGDVADPGQSPVRVPSPQILTDPAPPAPRWNFTYALVNDLLMFGNHISYVADRDDLGLPTVLLPLPIADVAIRQDSVLGPPLYMIWGVTLTASEVWHVSSGNVSGSICGRGLVQQYARSLGADLAAEEFSARYYSTGAQPTGVIGHSDPNLTTEGATATKQAFLNAVGGRKREPVVLPAGSTYTPIVTKADESQLLEARTWNATTIATIFGVPPYILGLPAPSHVLTYQNAEMLSRVFVGYCVSRWTKLLEAHINRSLLPPGQSAVFDFSSLLAPDHQTLVSMLAQEVGSGIATIDEARAQLNLPALEAEAQNVALT